MSQQRGAPRGRGRGQPPGSRGGRGSSPSTRGRGSPAPSAGAESSFSPRGGMTGRGGPRGGGPAVPSHGGGAYQARGGGPGGPPRGGFRGGAPGSSQVFAAGQPVPQDPRLGELDQLVQSFKRLQLQPEMPLRPGWGSLGQPGVVRANFFAVKMPAKATWYEYEIAILPKAQAKGDRRARIMELVEQSPQFSSYARHVAHDRSQRLVSVHKLPQPLEVPIRYLEEDQVDDPKALNFTVEFNLLGELQTSTLTQYMSGKPEHRNIDTQPLVSALNLILQQHASKTGVRVGKNKYFFPSSSEHHQLSLGVEAFRGFFMSVRPMYKQLMVNINVCMTAFYVPGNLAQAMLAFQRQSSGGMPQAFANRLKVSTKHLGFTRKYTISRIMTGKNARTERFDCAELGGMVTVEDFFRRKYRINLRHAHDLPLINVSMKKDRPIYLPAEICDIPPGQAFRGKLDSDQTAAMIKVACNPPGFNGDAIVEGGFADLGLRPDADASALGVFGLSVSPEMAGAPDRLLPPPSISYRAGRPPQVREAGWNILDVKFQVGGTMTQWAVLLVQEGRRDEFRGKDDPQLETFLETFLAKCNASGIQGANKPPTIMSVNLPPPRDKHDPRENALEVIRQAFRSNLNRNAKPSFILVLLSGVDKYIYPGIKKLADVTLGMHTIHMLLNKARDNRPNKQDQYFSNVVLKVNMKLGGTNHLLDTNSMSWLRAKKTMLMGIDVTHPGPGSVAGTPSIAAVVASIDENFAQYPASLRLQKADWNRESKEMVESLTQMTIERLLLYQKKNRRLPERIIVYRDGVSEGQYSQVLTEELPRLQAAFKQISPQTPYKPALTIVVCGKRHHARFFPTTSQHASRNGNTLPGTVIDKAITDIYNFDFYLQAHNGLQGHVKSTHYTVVYDENRFSADAIQQGTHTASYHYARATKAVSLVPPAYYADIACERGRDYLNVLLNTAPDDRSSVAGSRSTADKEAEKDEVFQRAVRMWGEGVHSDLRESMFYI